VKLFIDIIVEWLKKLPDTTSTIASIGRDEAVLITKMGEDTVKITITTELLKD